MTEIERISKELGQATLECSERWRSAPQGMSFEEYSVYMAPAQEKQDRLYREFRMLVEPEMNNHSATGTLMTLEEFMEYVKSGSFTDYDGFGSYSTLDQESDISIYPSDVAAGKIRTDFTHVKWFNR